MNERGTAPVVVLIALDDLSHRRRVAPIATELIRQGANLVVVDTDDARQFWRDLGASVVDLHTDGTHDESDARSTPMPARRVAFAAKFGRQLA